MIDVVFQLIIFFIVTITLNQEMKEEIELEWAENAAERKEQPTATVIEVDRRGWISMHGAALSRAQLRGILENKKRRLRRQFPVLIRGDWRTQHKDIRAVMDICTGLDIWKIDFIAMKDDRAGHGRKR